MVNVIVGNSANFDWGFWQIPMTKNTSFKKSRNDGFRSLILDKKPQWTHSKTSGFIEPNNNNNNIRIYTPQCLKIRLKTKVKKKIHKQVQKVGQGYEISYPACSQNHYAKLKISS